MTTGPPPCLQSRPSPPTLLSSHQYAVTLFTPSNDVHGPTQQPAVTAQNTDEPTSGLGETRVGQLLADCETKHMY